MGISPLSADFSDIDLDRTALGSSGLGRKSDPGADAIRQIEEMADLETDSQNIRSALGVLHLSVLAMGTQVTKLRALDANAPESKVEAEAIDDTFVAMLSSAMRTCGQLRLMLGNSDRLDGMILAIQSMNQLKAAIKKRIVEPQRKRVQKKKT